MNSRKSFACGMLALVFFIFSLIISTSVETTKWITLVRNLFITLSAILYQRCYLDIRDNRQFLRQFALINLISFVFGLSFMLVTIRTVVYIRYLSQMYMYVVWFLTGGYVLLKTGRVLLDSFKNMFSKESGFYLIFSTAVAVILVICSYDVDGSHFVWDSYTIFGQIYDRTVMDLFDIGSFFVFGHVDPAYFFPIFLLSKIVGDIGVAFFITNAICLIVATFSVVSLIRKTLMKESRIYVIVASLAILLSPYILGISTYYSYDYVICCFAPLLFLVALEENWLYFFVLGTVISLTKETGFIFVGSVCAGILLKEILVDRQSIRNVIIRKRTVSWLFIAALFALLYRLYSGWMEIVSTDGFRIDAAHMIRLLKVYLLLNWEWVVTGLVLGLAIFCIILKRRVCGHVIVYAVSAALFLLFNLMFVTYENPRYTDAFPMCMMLMLISLLPSVFEGRMKVLIASAVSVLMLISSFVSVDPLSARIFYTKDIGKGVIHATTGDGVGGDHCVYNRQYYGLDVVLERSLGVAIDSESEIIAVSLAKDALNWGIDGGHYSCEEREGFRYFTEHWDPNARKRVKTYDDRLYDSPGVKPFDIRYVYPGDDTVTALKEGETFTYIFMPSQNEGREDKVREELTVTDEGTFESHGWVMSYIRGVSKKDL